MAVKTLNPVAVGFYQDMTVTGAATTWEALSDTNHNTYTTPVFAAPFTKKETYLYDEIPSDVPGTTPVAGVLLYYEPLTAGGFPTTAGLRVKALLRLGGADTTSADVAPVVDAVVGGPSAIKEIDVTSLRPGGGVFTAADFQTGSRVQLGIQIEMDASSGSTIPSDSKLKVVVTYQAVVPSFDAGREVAGRMLRLRRRLIRTYTVQAPLWFLDAQLGDDVTIDYFLAEDPAGLGWLQKLWQRGWLKIVEIRTNFMAYGVTLKLLWLREWAVLWWDTMSSESPAGIYGQGVARFSLGEKRTFVRASAAWINSVVTGGKAGVNARNGLYYLAVDNVEKVTPNGTIFMSARTNKLLHSTFIQGTLPTLTGWTLTPGAGNTVAGEVIPGGIPPLLETQVGGRRVKIVKTGANPAEALNANTVSVGANVTGWVSFGHLDADATKPLQWAARRTLPGPLVYYWNNVGQTWGAAGGAKVWNSTTGSSTGVGVNHYKIPFGGTAGTLEIMVGVDGAASNRTVYAYHAQWVEALYLSDELIVTTTVAYTVAGDDLSIENNSGTPAEVRRILPSSAFVATWKAKAFWSPADLAAGSKRTMLSAEYDASNSIKVLYDKDNARIEAQYKRAGVTVTAFKALAVVADTFYSFGLRVIGSTGELDMTAYTVSIFINGVKGTDATAAAAATMPSTASLKIGQEGTLTNVWDGKIAHFEVTHEVLSDLEISGKP